MKCKLVAYYRVSTEKQGVDGLGMGAQEAVVRAYVQDTGCDLIASYTEVESGRKSDRTQLGRAMAHAKRSKATLVIAKMDRLSRNVHFISGLMESNVPFVACDNPHANRLTIHILAAVAEQEARSISERTRDALAKAKARGFTKAGKPWHEAKANNKFTRKGTLKLTREGTLKGSAAGVAAIRQQKAAAYADLLPELREMAERGMSLRAIASRLNDDGYTTRRGRPWNAVQVSRVLGMESA